MSERRFGRTPGGVCSLRLHVVLGGRVGRCCGELLEQIVDEHGWQVVAREVMPDHVHVFAGVGPTDAPVQVAREFKGGTARTPASTWPTAPGPSPGFHEVSVTLAGASSSQYCAPKRKTLGAP